MLHSNVSYDIQFYLFYLIVQLRAAIDLDKLSISKELIHLVLKAGCVVTHQWLLLIRVVVNHLVLAIAILVVCYGHCVVFTAFDVLHEASQILALG